jgi:hypothetical protein
MNQKTRSRKKQTSVCDKTSCETFYFNHFGDWNNSKRMLYTAQFDVFREKQSAVPSQTALHTAAQCVIM